MAEAPHFLVFATTQRKIATWSTILAASFIWLFSAVSASAATLHLSPAAGTFTVDSTFTVSIFLNTENEAVNTIGTTLLFPPDRLQLVSPSTGSSIISLWTTLPQADNQTGRITLQGGVPGGIKVNNGLVMALTFRAKSVGQAFLKFADNSAVLLNDGKGTDVLRQSSNGIYTLVLPPPAGPTVVSETHPDQAQWYANSTVSFRWLPDSEADGYSYILNDQPIDFPDDIAESNKLSVTHQNVGDGIKYFHIKAIKDGSWGGSTHFAIKVDVSPPAQFPIEVIPGKRTTRRQPIIQFNTTDALSGLDHFELKIVPLSRPDSASGTSAASQPQLLFIDATSPYLPPELALGNYDIIIRAYDQAHNYREAKQRLAIVTSVFQFVSGEGLAVVQRLVIPWWLLWFLLSLLIIILLFAAWRLRRWHHSVLAAQAARDLPRHVQKQLRELQQYRLRYGKMAAMLILIAASVFFGGRSARAESIAVPPPLINTLSKDITNEEIFYVGGNASAPFATVVLYLQNTKTGETVSQMVKADKIGQWFYRHNTFLSSGDYLLWAQNKIADEFSTPSPQVQFTVHTAAIQFGVSRISYETLYLLLFAVALLIVLALMAVTISHWVLGRRRHRAFMKEVREAEESVRRGFAVLRRDIEAEIAVVRRAKLAKELSAEEAEKEAQLMKDLTEVERYIGKEIWDIEQLESRGMAG